MIDFGYELPCAAGSVEIAGRALGSRVPAELVGVKLGVGVVGCVLLRPYRAGRIVWAHFPGPPLRSSPGYHIAGLRPWLSGFGFINTNPIPLRSQSRAPTLNFFHDQIGSPTTSHGGAY